MNDSDIKNTEEITKPEEQRKLLVGGLSIGTTDEKLREYFSQFGDILDCKVLKDRLTQGSRGFGFVTFKRNYMADQAMEKQPHKLDGRTVTLKREVSGEVFVDKIFVNGFKNDTGNQHLENYFSKFGAVEDVKVVMDLQTGKKEAFAFLTFEDQNIVDKIVSQKYHTINGYICEVKKALPSPGMEYPRRTAEYDGKYNYNRHGPSSYDRYPQSNYDRNAPPSEYDRYREYSSRH